MFTDVLNKKEDNIAHDDDGDDDDGDDDENRLCPRFSSILSIGSSLKCFDRDCPSPGYQRSFSRFGLRFGRAGHERVDRNRKPRQKSLWHPGYMETKPRREIREKIHSQRALIRIS